MAGMLELRPGFPPQDVWGSLKLHNSSLVLRKQAVKFLEQRICEDFVVNLENFIAPTAES